MTAALSHVDTLFVRKEALTAGTKGWHPTPVDVQKTPRQCVPRTATARRTYENSSPKGKQWSSSPCSLFAPSTSPKCSRSIVRCNTGSPLIMRSSHQSFPPFRDSYPSTCTPPKHPVGTGIAGGVLCIAGKIHCSIWSKRHHISLE